MPRRDAADVQDGSQKEEHAEEQKDTERTEAKAVSEKKTANVAAVAVAAAHTDKAEERGGGEGKQWAAERQEAEGAGLGMQGRGLSQEKDDDDGLQDESPAKRKSKSKKKRAGHAEQCGAAAGGEGGGRAADVRFLFSYESLSKATKNFEKRLGGGGCGSVFQGVLVSGTRVAVKRLELGVAAGAGAVGLSMTDQMRTEVEVLSQVQHVNIVPLLGSSKDGMAPCLVYALMEGGSLQDRLACRGSGALMPLTANERILVLSDVARGLAYLHSEVRVIHGDVKSANVLLDEACRGRIGDFGIAKSLNDKNAGIAVTHVQTEHVMGTQVYMAPEYIKGELSTKVDAFAFGLVIIETLTGYAVCSPAPGHRNLLSMFEQDLDTASKFLAHLDKRACWDQHKQERIGRLYGIADRCLEARRKKRPELVELIPELEELRRGTHALPADVRMLSELNSFHCPLTMEVMRDPVMTGDGQTYERVEIESWFALGNRTSPLTGAELPSTNLAPNIALRNAICDNGLL
jgi:interleukin-1 receptor-associated kinase 4